MRKPKIYIQILLLGLMCSGCELLHHDDVVATVGECRLLRSELDAVTNGYKGEDSLSTLLFVWAMWHLWRSLRDNTEVE